jgi:hypothetical protein
MIHEKEDTSRISGSQGREYEATSLLQYCAVYTRSRRPAFHRCLLPPSSWLYITITKRIKLSPYFLLFSLSPVLLSFISFSSHILSPPEFGRPTLKPVSRFRKTYLILPRKSFHFENVWTHDNAALPRSVLKLRMPRSMHQDLISKSRDVTKLPVCLASGLKMFASVSLLDLWPCLSSSKHS